ncbi:MAG TPA: CoA-transferase [Propionibacteriaceae bacterium]
MPHRPQKRCVQGWFRGSSTAASCILEYPLRADAALVSAHIANELGSLLYRKTARNFGPIMAGETTM